ncbi:MAG: phosphoethanolamine transferase [Victivallales bacterium]|nr:phosphoethanolamine transferase [Victivallales bacterium]
MNPAVSVFLQKVREHAKRPEVRRWLGIVVCFAVFFGLFFLDILNWYPRITKMRLGAWYWVIRESFFFSCFFTMWYAFFGKRVKHLLYIAFCLILFLTGVEFFVQKTFAMVLDGDILLMLIMSSSEQIMEFIGMYLNKLSCLLLFLIGLTGYCLWRFGFRKLNLVPDRWTALAGAILLALFLYDNAHWILHQPSVIFEKSMATYLVFDIFNCYKGYRNLGNRSKAPLLPEDVQTLPVNPERFPDEPKPKSLAPIGVFVIGESSSRNYWSLYGYSRKTTPEMDAIRDELLIFHNLQAVGTGTGRSIQYITTQELFAPNKSKGDFEIRCTLFDIYKQAGWKTYLFSTPSRWGRWETVEGILFNAADKKIYLSEELKDRTFYSDHDQLPFFRQELAENPDQPLFCVMHLTGSHMPPENRIPKDFGPFTDLVDEETRNLPENKLKKRNNYDNSLRWTDQYFGELIRILKEQKRPSFLCVIADHGESPKELSWRLMTSKDTFQLPLLLWFSPEYKQAWPEFVQECTTHLQTPIEVDRLFWGIVDLGRIQCKDFPKDLDFVSREFKPVPFHFKFD